MSDLERIEAAMEEKVRPALRSHGGDISIDHVEGKTVYVKLLGQCAGCPSADLTNETIVEAELKAALPELVEKAVVVQTVSDELWEQAKKLLREHHLRLPRISHLLEILHKEDHWDVDASVSTISGARKELLRHAAK